MRYDRRYRRDNYRGYGYDSYPYGNRGRRLYNSHEHDTPYYDRYNDYQFKYGASRDNYVMDFDSDRKGYNFENEEYSAEARHYRR